MKRKETYLSRDFRETAAQRFPAQAKQLNAAFDMRLNALLAENAGASKEKQYHLKRQILDRKSTRLNSSHWNKSRMPSSA